MKLRLVRLGSSRLLRLAVYLITSAILASCGGGGGGDQVASGGVGGTGGGAGGGGGGTGGGGNGGVGGVGGTGIVALGTVAGFGSIVVNGSHYEVTPATKVAVDDNTAATATDLKLGMVVEIAGRQNATTALRDADTITYRSNVIGPISQIALDCKSMTVMGQSVDADANTLPTLNNGLCDFNLGDIVEVSGFVTDAPKNVIRATLLQPKAAPALLRLSGQIDGLDEQQKSLLIGKLTVDFGGAELKPQGITLHKGDQVIVAGTLAAADRLTATSVTMVRVGLGVTAGTEAEVEGYVANLSGKTFTINGQPVDASTAVIEPATAQLQGGIKVEVEGKVDNQGVLVAAKIEVKPQSALVLEGNVQAVSASGLDLLGQTILVDGLTLFEDGSSANVANLKLTHIKPPNHLTVSCWRDSVGNLIAATIKRKNASNKASVEGPIRSSNPTANSLEIGWDKGTTVVGISAAAEIEANHQPVSAAEFFQATKAGALVKVRGKMDAGADNIDVSGGTIELE